MENIAVDAALDTLIGQFSSAYDCLRELVQNSIDAGSPEIEVWTEFVPSGDGPVGTIVLHVDDYGVGMDESVIDNELTRLFASSKENDLTKVGKFGIGFVSIFALGPEAVLLHTGRGGSWWEVLFHKDRTFTKRRLEVPVEGTQIALYLTGGTERYREVVRNSWQSLHFWCRYSDVPITFEDRSGLYFEDGPRNVNEEFGVRASVAVNVERGDTLISLGYAKKPSYGFYNRGLTLAVLQDPDQVPPRFRHVSFEVKSPYLEHTLSRETVLRDDNYAKAMKMLREAADEVLFPALLDRLEQLAGSESFDLDEQALYEELLFFLSVEPKSLFRQAEDRRIVRRADGAVMTLAEAARAAESKELVVYASGPSVLSQKMLERGFLVVWGRPGSDGSVPVLIQVIQRHIRLGSGLLKSLWHSFAAPKHLRVARPEDLFVPVQILAGQGQLGQLGRSVAQLLGIRRDRVRFGRLEAPLADVPLLLAGSEVDELMPVTWKVTDLRELHFVLNADHPYVQSALGLTRHSPALAAVLLARAVSLVLRLGVPVDWILVRAYGQGRAQ